MVEIKFRNIVTLIVIGGLIGGAGIAITYEDILNPETSLGDNQLFNIWIGAILGYGGSIITFLYSQQDSNKPI